MADGSPWPGNNPRDHPGMIQVTSPLCLHYFIFSTYHVCSDIFIYSHRGTQVFLGNSGALDTHGNRLPRLVYVSREKRPGFQHHKKAGAMNALVH